jgi:hypothetical protein
VRDDVAVLEREHVQRAMKFVRREHEWDSQAAPLSSIDERHACRQIHKIHAPDERDRGDAGVP